MDTHSSCSFLLIEFLRYDGIDSVVLSEAFSVAGSGANAF